MKLKVVFLKKKHIYMVITLIIALILFIIFFNFKKTSSKTFNIVPQDTILKSDFTGDGKEDILYIKTNEDKYLIQINTNNDSLYLKPDKNLNSIGTYCEHWPMRLTLQDISRDSTPEIFIQASEKNKPIQHVFIWNNNNFKDIFCSSNNIFGFIDSNNNKTPKFVSGNYSNGKILLTHYILIKDKVKSFQYKYDDNYMGKNTIECFIKNINNLSQDDLKNLNCIFENNFDKSNLLKIINLLKEGNNLALQDAIFKDMKYDTDGSPCEIQWDLSFKQTNKDNSTPKNLNLSLNLTKDKTNNNKNLFLYNISSIK